MVCTCLHLGHLRHLVFTFWMLFGLTPRWPVRPTSSTAQIQNRHSPSAEISFEWIALVPLLAPCLAQGSIWQKTCPDKVCMFFFVCERFQYSCFSRQPRHAIRVQLRPARAMSMQKKALEFTLGFVLCYFAVAAWVKFLQFPKQGICKKGCETEATTHCVVTGWPQLAPTGRWSFSTRRLCILSSL